METKICKVCGHVVPLTSFMITRWGTRSDVCNVCVGEKRAQTRYERAQVGGGKTAPLSDPDFDGRDPGEVWRLMCRAEKWLNSRGYAIQLDGEYREVKIRKLKKE